MAHALPPPGARDPPSACASAQTSVEYSHSGAVSLHLPGALPLPLRGRSLARIAATRGIVDQFACVYRKRPACLWPSPSACSCREHTEPTFRSRLVESPVAAALARWAPCAECFPP